MAKVAATASSIGYANLADSRANAAFIPRTGGPNKATFWAPIQNKEGYEPLVGTVLTEAKKGAALVGF